MGEMKETCEGSGIQLNTPVRYSPESNGVTAERTIGVLTSACGPMLHDSGLPNSAATFLHNRMPTKALEGCTPYEVISTRCFASLHIWGVVRHRRAERIASVIKDLFFQWAQWDPKRRVVVESSIVFFEDRLPPPTSTLNGPRQPQDDADDSVIRPATDHTNELPAPQDASAPPQPLATPHTAQSPATPGSLPKAAPQPQIAIRLPGRRVRGRMRIPRGPVVS